MYVRMYIFMYVCMYLCCSSFTQCCVHTYVIHTLLLALSLCTFPQSYAAGEKPKFGHVLFNVHGRSPLVQHYLLRRGLGHDSGWSLLLQRTEVVSVPPREAETYRDVLRSSGKVLRRIEKDFDRCACILVFSATGIHVCRV